MTDTHARSAAHADFWFDPSCPFTWATSRWLLEAARARGFAITWRVLSLAALNEHRDTDPEGDTGGYLWLPVRVALAVERGHGQDDLAAFYTAYGTRVHERGADDAVKVFEEALAEAGLPGDLLRAALDDGLDDAVRASTAEGLERVDGNEVGSPIIGVTAPDGARGGVFGPVLSRVPRGEEAGRLWDGIAALAPVRGFNELKGGPRGDLDFS
ncbi:mycothiol-dependent nitroreductase Rv2466c family protein [Actinomadura parmotrematis]|uniref:Disulfide bond formation protein DsbA n=1 Tax=Actinomadura parmotrematis TaxID=2864039 RepID=A0ABS7G2T5_9ACTN|nr:disulfide bond formation protein DsbA [Actinomadura parmotrematis]MBW8486791.1 disulfide bond formation protein DsbA [Actinomadura parmotrematis]